MDSSCKGAACRGSAGLLPAAAAATCAAGSGLACRARLAGGAPAALGCAAGARGILRAVSAGRPSLLTTLMTGPSLGLQGLACQPPESQYNQPGCSAKTRLLGGLSLGRATGAGGGSGCSRPPADCRRLNWERSVSRSCCS